MPLGALFGETTVRAIQRSPLLQRTLVDLLRRSAPVRRIGATYLVTGAGAVREVLARPDDFLPGVCFAPKLKLGASVLGMDRSPVYDAERTLLRGIFERSEPLERFGGAVARACVQRAAYVGPGHADLLSDYIEPALVLGLGELFGLKVERATSRIVGVREGHRVVAHWMRKLGSLLLVPVPAPFGQDAVSEALKQEMASFLGEEVARIEPGADPAGPLIAQLKHAAGSGALPSEADLARCVGTMLLAGATMFAAATRALHQLLLRRQAVWPGAVAAAERRDAEAVLGYVWEALRFDPVFPFLPRYCPRATTLDSARPAGAARRGWGATCGARVAAGATVLASPLGAMFDPAAVSAPEEFVPTRERGTYLHFAYGLHECIARELASVALAQVFIQLLTTFELPAAGVIRWDGSTPDSYAVARAGKKRQTRETPIPDHSGPSGPGAGEHPARPL